MEQDLGPLNDDDVQMEPAPLLIPAGYNVEEVWDEPEIGKLKQKFFLITSL